MARWNFEIPAKKGSILFYGRVLGIQSLAAIVTSTRERGITNFSEEKGREKRLTQI